MSAITSWTNSSQSSAAGWLPSAEQLAYLTKGQHHRVRHGTVTGLTGLARPHATPSRQPLDIYTEPSGDFGDGITGLGVPPDEADLVGCTEFPLVVGADRQAENAIDAASPAVCDGCGGQAGVHQRVDQALGHPPVTHRLGQCVDPLEVSGRGLDLGGGRLHPSANGLPTFEPPPSPMSSSMMNQRRAKESARRRYVLSAPGVGAHGEPPPP